jgi:glucosamine--fructose-6-phosphate aminotransferase (isomerizing)
MCGIVGIVGKNDVADLLIEGLRRLEYRGYDSAGLATLSNGHIERRRAEGKLINLERKLFQTSLPGRVGIGHTRWATHGAPNEINAHPHATDKVAIVHNGIIENYQALKAELMAKGHVFESETDTETVVHLVTENMNQGMEPVAAARSAFKRLEGAFSLVLIFAGYHDLMVATRNGTPLTMAHSPQGIVFASDAVALVSLTNKVIYLEDGDWVVVEGDKAIIRNTQDQIVDRPVRKSTVSAAMVGKGEFRHFMLKEIHEQPEAIGDTLNGYIHPATGQVNLPNVKMDFNKITRLTISACGTAFYAGMVAKYWFERLAKLPVELDIASEFRYRDAPLPEGGAIIVVSQSGETLDTLEALRYAKQGCHQSLAVVNVVESTIAREADNVLYTLAGPEIGVASTKAFTTQLCVLACIAIAAGRQRGTLTEVEARQLTAALREAPARIAEVLSHESKIAKIAQDISDARDVLYLGRGTSYPLALEGALKLKEISYIHAEGYAAGEMKHGPIALIDEKVPVVVLAPHDRWFDKTTSNVEEAMARGAQVLMISDAAGVARLKDRAVWSFTMPVVDEFVAPLVYSVPIQLLSYHVAVIKGTDVDQPRNLAKSVTVE